MNCGKFLFKLAIVFCFAFSSGIAWGGEMDKTGTLWAPYSEWTFTNPTYSGNPFDLIASATFIHSGGETRTTEMFYAGNNTWKFRFTGTKTGEWTFTTSSIDSDLDGHSGTVTINPNPDPNVKGFVTSIGNKWARQVGENGELETFTFNIFQGNVGIHPINFYFNPDPEAQLEYMVGIVQENGCSSLTISGMANHWFDLGSWRWDEHSSTDPDIRSFEALEMVITYLHSNGSHVHFWAWGDESRKQTPIGAGGINGVPDRRVQRYIAARLGPLPGWTMGYGFDLQEWVTEDQIGSWAEYMHDHMGWQHMLMARGRSHSELDAKAYSGLNHPYNDAVSNFDGDTIRPHIFSERDLYEREGNTMTVTRRHFWQYTLAGGHGGWWGWHWANDEKPYSNPEQLRAHYRFWNTEKRFLADMARANTLTDGYCLKSTDNKHYIFYKEDTSSIQMDLSGMADAQQAVAVNTKLAYTEIDLGTFNPTNQTWTAPYSSDWAIAVGGFSERPSDTSPPTAPQSLDGIPISESQIDLTWQAASDPESGISGYKVYRDGTFIRQSSSTSFSDTGLAANTSYAYEVSAVNGAGLESEKSAPISATTLADITDTIAPSIISGTTSGDPNKVTVVFSEPVEEASSENISNYGIDNDVTISGASLALDLKTVVLTTSPHTDGVTYTLNVNNIRDRASTPNVIAANTQVTYAFAGQLVISNLTVDSGKAYEVIENGLQSGSLVYIDRIYTFKDVPASLLGATYIKTANADKGLTGDSFMSFDVNQDVTVYVAHDNRIATKPSWMTSFTDTGDDLVTTDATFSIFAKHVSAGTVTLGGNEVGYSMYVAIIVAQGTPLPTAPTGLSIVSTE